MHLHPTQENGRALVQRGIEGPVVMLNLLRFRKVADYTDIPLLAPTSAISGAEAYERYAAAVAPLLHKAGSELLYRGEGGAYFIGPQDEHWDLVLLVKHRSVMEFFAFATDPDYLAVAGHRTAALEDSRLLPLS